MWFIIGIVLLMLIAAVLESTTGKIIIAAGILAIGCLILNKIFELAFLVTLAKICAAIMIIVIIGSILGALFN